MSKKRKYNYQLLVGNQKEIKNTIALFTDGYGISVQKINYYQFRLRMEDYSDIFYDWYFTTGSLVKNTDGYPRSEGCYPEAEDVACGIKYHINDR